MKIISFFPKDLPISYGSYLYRYQRWSSDIDLLQYVDYKDEETTINTFNEILKKIVRSLDKNHIYSEFKAGIDPNYLIEVGELINSNFQVNKDLNEILYTKWKNKLFTDLEYWSMIAALKYVATEPDNKEIQCDGFDFVYSLVRNKRILRWSAEEILKGYKIISDNRKYSLYEAIQDDTICKIDLIVYINNRFMEITNLILLTYTETDEYGHEKHIPINISEAAIHNAQALKLDIEKLYYSDKFYSPMKACKRMYGFMRATKGHYEYLVHNLAPVLTSNASALYQMKSEIEAILIVLDKKYNKINLDRSKYHLQDIKSRLNYILEMKDITVIDLSHKIDKITALNNKQQIIEQLEELLKFIKFIVNSLTISKMNEFRINPPPPEFIAYPVSYNNAIVRTVEDKPTDEYKQFVKEIETAARGLEHFKKLILIIIY